VVVLFLDQDLWSDHNTNITWVSIISIGRVIVNQFDLLHHGCNIVMTLLAMMCRRLQYRRVLSPFLKQDIMLVAANLKVLGLWSLDITID
jgi:hypothetical protein